jgi:hypothetical protein
MHNPIVRPSAALLALVALGAAAEPPPPPKPCSTQLIERGLSPGPEWNEALGACRAKQAADVRAGVHGVEAQARAVCDEQVRQRGHVPGIGHYKTALDQCVAAHRAAAAGEPSSAQAPFGTGRMAEYMNAIYNEDFATLSEVNDELRRRFQSKLFAIPQPLRAGVSPMPLLWQNYLALYPALYRNCLEADAPSVMIGLAYDRVTTNGLGVEIRRERVDTRHAVPVNRRFYRVAQRIGPQHGNAFDDAFIQLAGLDLGEFSFGRVGHAVAQAMRRHACDGPVIQRFETQLLKLGATARERGESR